MVLNPALSTHPCYSEKAHRFFSRLHLPVAPKCNLQCNYCNRKYDCVNESRPGVTSTVLTPEKAFQRVAYIASQRKDLSVIGIAGPGDALANKEESFKAYRLIKKVFSDLTFCLSTNGIELVNSIDDIIAADIHHVTVTINTTDMETASQVYSRIKLDGKWRNDPQAYEELIYRQQAGIRELKKAGILVKANTILMPGINEKEIPSLSKRLSLMGITTHNIMPLIAKPEHGTRFGKENRPTPSDTELEEIRKQCGLEKQMAHCRQCRADAMGKLGEETVVEDTIPETDNWIEPDFGLEKRKSWRQLVNHMLTRQALSSLDKPSAESPFKIAVCTSGSGFADEALATTKELHVYQLINHKVTLLNVRRLETEKDRLEETMKRLKGCEAVISHQIGYSAFKKLEENEITPMADLSDLPVEEAVMTALKRLSEKRAATGQPLSFCADLK